MILLQLACSKLSVAIDRCDLATVAPHTWYAARRGACIYATANIDGTPTLMHRFLMRPPHGFEVDHRDHDGLNNTRANMRNVTHSINNHNRRGVKGYYFCRRTERWRASIEINKKRIRLGRFDSEECARRAYLDAKARLLGDNGLGGTDV